MEECEAISLGSDLYLRNWLCGWEKKYRQNDLVVRPSGTQTEE